MPIKTVLERVGINQFILILLLIAILIPIKLSSLLIALAVLIWVVSSSLKTKRDTLKKNKGYLLPFLLYFLFNGLSLLYSHNTELAWKDIEGKLSFLLIPVVVFSLSDLNLKRVKNSLLFFAFLVMIMTATAFVISLLSFGTIKANQELAGLVGMHASYLSLYLSFSIFIFLDKYLLTRNKLHLVLVVLSFIALVFLASRIVFLGISAVFFIWFVIRRFSWKAFSILCISLFVMAAISWSYSPIKSRLIEAIDFDDRVELDTNPEEHRTLGRTYGGRAIRVAIWDCAIDVVKENWLTGVGIGDVHDALQASYKNRAFEFAWRYNNFNAHNLFIETLIAFGLIGLMTVLLLFYQSFRLAFHSNTLLLFAAITLFFFLSFMESSFNVHRGVVFFCVVLPIVIRLGLSKVHIS